MAMLQIGGSDIPSPSDFSVNLFDIKKQARTASGRLVTDIVATNIRRLTLSYSYLTSTDATTLLTALVSAYALSVTYPDPYTGASRTGNFVISDRSAKAFPVYSIGLPWRDLAFELEEV